MVSSYTSRTKPREASSVFILILTGLVQSGSVQGILPRCLRLRAGEKIKREKIICGISLDAWRTRVFAFASFYRLYAVTRGLGLDRERPL